MAAPTVEPVGLVGRDRELSELASAVDQLEQGRGGALFLVGDPGMGKTALLEAALEVVRNKSLLAISARAWPLDARLAYAPLVQALGRWLRALDDSRRTKLVDGLCELSRLFSELDLPPSPELGEPALEKTRLFEAVARLLERACDGEPVVLALDDLHFADVSSIELWQYLLRRLFDAPFLLLCTVRTQAADGAASEFLRYAELAGAGRILNLGALDRVAERELLGRMLGGEAPGDDVCELIHRRSEGVPFFVQAIVRALLRDQRLSRVAGQWRLGPGAHTTLPRAARQLVLDVVQHLDADRRVVLDHLAVGGAEVDLGTLEAVCPLPRAALAEALSALGAQNLVRESTLDGTLGQYSISVPLAQEVLYEQLSEVERRAAHRRFLEAANTSTIDVTLARHIVGTGGQVADPEVSMRTLLAAAEEARGRYAHEEAARWYGAALALKPGAAAERADLLEALGNAKSALGESAAAVSAFSEALRLRSDEEYADAIASVRAKLSLELWNAGRLDESMSVLREGIAALEPRGPSVALARLYGASLVNAWRLGDGQWVREKAEKMSSWEQSDDTIAFEAALAHGNLLLARGEMTEARRSMILARDKARSVAEKLRVGRFRVFLAIVSGCIDDACLDEYKDLTRAASVPSLEMPYAFLLGLKALYGGELSSAIVQFEEASLEARFARSERMQAGVAGFLATARALAGRFDDARAGIEPIGSIVGSRTSDLHLSSVYWMALAALAIETNNADGARHAAEHMVAAGDESPFEHLIRAEAWLVSGDLDAAERALEHVLRDYSQIDYASAGANRVRGLAALARGSERLARERLQTALSMFEQTTMTFFTARVRLELAELEGTKKGDAVEAARRALQAFEASDARHWQERARALLRRHGEAVRRQTAAKRNRPLSERELQVARLAAQGMTNAQIGRELFISPHTAATHMKRILARAEVSNRPALAQWLRQNDLDESG